MDSHTVFTHQALYIYYPARKVPDQSPRRLVVRASPRPDKLRLQRGRDEHVEDVFLRLPEVLAEGRRCDAQRLGDFLAGHVSRPLEEARAVCRPEDGRLAVSQSVTDLDAGRHRIARDFARRRRCPRPALLEDGKRLTMLWRYSLKIHTGCQDGRGAIGPTPLSPARYSVLALVTDIGPSDTEHMNLHTASELDETTRHRLLADAQRRFVIESLRTASSSVDTTLQDVSPHLAKIAQRTATVESPRDDAAARAVPLGPPGFSRR